MKYSLCKNELKDFAKIPVHETSLPYFPKVNGSSVKNVVGFLLLQPSFVKNVALIELLLYRSKENVVLHVDVNLL